MPLGQGWDEVCVTRGEPHGMFGCGQLDAEMEAEEAGYESTNQGVVRLRVCPAALHNANRAAPAEPGRGGRVELPAPIPTRRLPTTNPR